jgi:hypothetical protein
LGSTLGVAAGNFSSGVATERSEFGCIGVGVGGSIFLGHDGGERGGRYCRDVTVFRWYVAVWCWCVEGCRWCVRWFGGR